MQASTVHVSSKTMEALSYKGLTPRKKRELRQERVKAYISLSKEKVSVGELIAAAGYRIGDRASYAAGSQFIRGMVNKKIIGNDGTPKLKKQWWVIKEDHQAVGKPSDMRVVNAAISLGQTIETHKMADTIEQKAKDFAWTHNSNDLREFIEWLKKI